jgi:hypothetical protein
MVSDSYTFRLSLDIYEVSKAAVDGHYEGEYFHKSITQEGFKDASPVAISRIRAVVQNLNTEFSEFFRKVAHKYHIDFDNNGLKSPDLKSAAEGYANHFVVPIAPIQMTKENALKWVAHVLARTRGRELVGNYNPLLVGELFWEQSSKWQVLAVDHIEHVGSQCSQFLNALLHDKCPKDVESRLWDRKIHDALRKRSREAREELAKIMEDIKGYPINYNHYYTDTIKSRRQNRQQAALAETMKQASQTTYHPQDGLELATVITTVDTEQVVKSWADNTDKNMENFSCEEALDCLLAIYKVRFHLVPHRLIRIFKTRGHLVLPLLADYLLRFHRRHSLQISQLKSLSDISCVGLRRSSHPSS